MTTLELALTRQWLTTRTTIGELRLGGRHECFILEDRKRALDEKVPGSTCIPDGRYRVQRTWSPRFERMMPLLWNVRTADGRMLVRSLDGRVSFEGVRIHWGNTQADTDGCLVTGYDWGYDEVFVSRYAFDRLDLKLAAAEAAGNEVWITITTEEKPNAPTG